MLEIILEVLVCLAVAALLMIYHETIKVIVYFCSPHAPGVSLVFPWKVWRYVDPVGMITALACGAPVSRPYLFWVWDPRINRRLGLAGFFSLAAAFAGSVAILKWGYGGLDGLDHLTVRYWYQMILPMAVQYLALLSFGMFVTNLFPVSVFDMGLLIIGCAPAKYTRIIRADGFTKLIFLLVLMLGVIRETAASVISLILG